MPDLIVVLVIALVVVLVWRGPKTLPKLGEALGRGVRAAREEAAREEPARDEPARDEPARGEPARDEARASGSGDDGTSKGDG